VGGQATDSQPTAALPAGTYSFQATYSGDGNYLPATGMCQSFTVPEAPFFTATDVAAGANGSVWVIGTNPVPGGYGIYRWTGSGWAAVPGGAVDIAVDPSGRPWLVNSVHRIYHWNGAGWTLLPGSATDVGVGANGSVWVVGTNPTGGGYGIYHWTGSRWAPAPGGAVTIAVDPSGRPWLVNSVHRVYQWNGAGWTLH
jgi:hypothetical protein